MAAIDIAEGLQVAKYGVERSPKTLMHVYPRGTCGRCIDCSGLHKHLHSVTSAGSLQLDEYEQWWPAGLQSPTLYYHIRARQLKYQTSVAIKRNAQWRETIAGQSDLLTKRGARQLPLQVPSAYTNVQENERVVFLQKIIVSLEPCKTTCIRSPFALLSQSVASCHQDQPASSRSCKVRDMEAAKSTVSAVPCQTPPAAQPYSALHSSFAGAGVTPDSAGSCQLSSDDSSTGSIGYAFHQPAKRTRTASGALPGHICAGHLLAPAVPASMAQSCQVSNVKGTEGCRPAGPSSTQQDAPPIVVELRPAGTAKALERQTGSSRHSKRDVLIPVLPAHGATAGGLCSPVHAGHLMGNRVSWGAAGDCLSSVDEAPSGGWFGQWLASWLDVNA